MSVSKDVTETIRTIEEKLKDMADSLDRLKPADAVAISETMERLATTRNLLGA